MRYLALVWLLYAANAFPACTVGAQGQTSLTASWTASATAGVTYNLYAGTASGAETKVQSGILGTTATYTGMVAGTTYYFFVTAQDVAGESVASNEACFQAVAPLPAAPTNLTVK